MLRIAVVDDENIYIEQITKYIKQYAKEKDRDIRAETFRDGNQLLEHYHSQYDIILLDIETSELSGMNTAREIRKMGQGVVLVFIIDVIQYAISGYEVGALDYVLKPPNYYASSVRLGRVIVRVKKWQTKEILPDLPGDIKRLKAENVHYIETQNRILHYHTGEGVFTVRGTLQGAKELLRESHLVQCNHRYLVSLRHVSGIGKDIVIVAGDELEISRRDETAFLSALTDCMGMGV